ncbi:MAG: hypothetical protein U0610_05800 [bacterium]
MSGSERQPTPEPLAASPAPSFAPPRVALGVALLIALAFLFVHSSSAAIVGLDPTFGIRNAEARGAWLVLGAVAGALTCARPLAGYASQRRLAGRGASAGGQGPNVRWASRALAISSLACLAIGALRVVAYFSRARLPGLEPDVAAYVHLARAMTHAYDTGPREPLVIWLARVALGIAGDGRIAPALLTSALFPILALQVFRLAYSIVPRFEVAWASAAVFLSNQEMLALACSGVRDTYFLSGLVVLARLAVTPGTALSPWRWAAWLTVGCLATIGIRITSLPPVLVLVAYIVVRNRLRPVLLVPALAATIVVLGPYLVQCQRQYGDAFHSANIHAVWWRNYEFVTLKGTGCSGCPTREELATNPYAGAPTSTFRYVFGMRSLPELTTQTIRGAIALFLDPTSKYFRFFLGVRHRNTLGGQVLSYLMLALPFYASVMAPLPWHRRVLFLVPVLFINVSVFTAMLDMPERIFAAAIPFAAIAWGVGGGEIARALRHLAGVEASSTGPSGWIASAT